MFCGCAKQNTETTDLTDTPQSQEQKTSAEQASHSSTEKSTSSVQAAAKPDITETPDSTSPAKQSTAEKSDITTTEKDDSVITVTVFCSCKNAVDYGIRDKKDYVPSDGIILNTTVTLKKGSSALDAIKEACLKGNAEIDENRGYIRGIGGLYEKDCGGASGWMYSVNGTFPNVSSDKYALSSDDRIEFHYTVKYGDTNNL